MARWLAVAAGGAALMPDLARDGLANLQQRMLRATVAARSPAELVAVQRDLVEGARRLSAAVLAESQAAALEGWPDLLQRLAAVAQVEAFYRDAQAALARYEQAAALEAGE